MKHTYLLEVSAIHNQITPYIFQASIAALFPHLHPFLFTCTERNFNLSTMEKETWAL